MDNLDPTTTVALTAFLSWLGTYLTRKVPGLKAIWTKIPDDLQWTVPLAMAAGAAFFTALREGKTLQQAAGIAASAAWVAIIGHHGAKALPFIPYGNDPAPPAAQG